TPLAPVTLALHDQSAEADRSARLAATTLDVDAEAILDDLRFDLELGDGTLHGWWRYSRDLFEPATIAGWARQFVTLAREAAANPDRPLSTMSPLTDAERRLIVDEWNLPPAPFAPPVTIHAAFQRQASAAPDAPALLYGEETISYGALAADAAALARVLRRHGVVPGATVGICLDRSPALAAALLATWQAGGVCLPLDPAYPAARLAYMLEDAGARLIVTDARGEAALPAGAGPRLRLDQPFETAAPDLSETAGDRAGDDLAYLVYTSGSTGQPKGVIGTHRGAVNLCRWLGAAYPFAADDVTAFLASASFVDAVWDLLGPLLNGAATVIVPDVVRKDPERLIELLSDYAVSRLLAPPSLLRAMLDTDADFAAETPRLRLLFSTAETMTPELAQRIAERMPQARLINTYGSSETTAVVITGDVAPNAAARPRVPIGRPIANCRVYVLDDRGALAPVGAPGEIAVGGAAIAAGYHGRPELTAERFAPDPFAGDPSSRLFRTGDRGRWLADGSLEWLGRRDRLVKIRGFRVEPGEVEAALLAHPVVREAAVVARAGDGVDPRLVAYVVARETPELAVADLRAFLRRSLPEFLLPAQFVALPALPRTPSGKIDRRALPPDRERSAPSRPPRTPTEAALAAIWERLLATRPIGVDDNFFDLGGQSLLVVRAVAAMRDALGVDLPARALFEAPTIAALAGRVDASGAARPAADNEPTGAIAPLNAGSGAGIFLVPGGAGEAFNLVPFAKLFRRVAPDRAAWGFIGRERFGGDDDRDAQAWVRRIAVQYIDELRSRQPDGPYVIVGACAGGNIAFEMAQQLHAAGAAVERLILMDVWHTGGRSVR
ncbi:MAG TPA: amino acid adenylation domain-containing protein, partial [Thermomicrobiales bacterium]|nr:amino acid adenylation domain-containing protein [Thermomicrobiales bacterium]